MSGFGSTSAFGAPSIAAPVGQATTRPIGLSSPAFGAPSPFSQPNTFGGFSGMPTDASQPLRQKSPFEPSGAVPSNMTSQTNGSGFGGSPFGGSNAPSVPNPFATPSSSPFTNAPASSNPFAAKPIAAATNNPFGIPAENHSKDRPASPFIVAPPTTNGASNPFAQVTGNDRKRKDGFSELPSSKPQAQISSQQTISQAGGFGAKPKLGSSFANFGDSSGKKAATSQAMKPSVSNGFGKPTTSYAQAIHDQLQRDGIKPPRWPAEPGNPKKRKALEDFKDTYKQYLSRVRTSLIKAGLVDDPDVRKSLSDAIDFKGTCEDMCPEYEKVSRITEHDVRRPEKERQADGVEWDVPDRMVKAFKRSAAGADYPLPMEVRSPAALRRTVDYLMDDLLRSDDRLPALHNFLWDRTRAVRKDFIFQNAMTTEERLDQIYCLETLARFHAVGLHLLSQEGVAADDFSEQQEKEQLGKTLLSLMQVYDESKDDGLVIKNEAEFRAYYLLFNAHDPFVKQQLQDWGRDIWFESDEIQTVVSLMEAMQNVFRHRGPLRPAAPLTTASNSFTNYFSIVEDSKVSYTMACFAEIHFTEIRRHLLKTINKAFGRVRDHPKDLTAEAINNILRFDETSQCIEFLEKHGMEFSSDANPSYLLVERRKHIPSPTVKQSHSAQMVERKRGNHSLPEVIHSTIFETASLPNEQGDSPDDMFLPSETPMETGPSQADQSDYDVTDEESSVSAPSKPSIFAPPINPPTTLPPFSSAPPQGLAAAQSNPPRNPFESGAIKTQPSMEKPSPFQPSSGFSWPAKATGPAVETGSSSTAKPAFSWASPSSAAGGSPSPNAMNAFPSFDKGTESVKQPAMTSAVEISKAQPNAFSGFATSLEKQPNAPSIMFTPPTPGRVNTEQQQSPAVPTVALDSSTDKPSHFPQSSRSELLPGMGFTTQPQSTLHHDGIANINSQALPSVPDIPKQQFETKFASPPKPAAPAQQSKPKDLMGSFAKWMVLGDDGLIDRFQDAILEHLVKDVYERYKVEEEERRRKEEDEQSWAEALKFRRYNLGLKFFYRWREITRSLVRKRMGRQNREAMKAYREAQAAQAAAAKAAREHTKRKAAEDHNNSINDATMLVQHIKDRANKRARTSSSQRESSTDSLERALLASGVFAGISNQREAVSKVVHGDSSFQAPPSPFAQTAPATGFVVPATRHRDPLRPVNTGVSKSIAKPKESAKKRWLRDIAAGKHTDGTVNGLLSHKAVNNFSHSLPAGTKVTNFTRYQTSSPRSSIGPESQKSKQSSGVKSDYWRLKARGLVVMPDGRALHESLALPMMYDGVRYPGIGDYGLGPGKNHPAEPNAILDVEGDSAELAVRRRSSLQGRNSEWSPRSSLGRSSILRRSLPEPKPQPHGEARVDQTQAADKESYMPADVEATLQEFKALAAEMDEGTTWFKEQNDMMLSGQSPFGPQN